MDANLNGIPLNWKADLTSNSVDKVTIHKVTNNLNIGDKKIDLTLLWNMFSANYTIHVDDTRISHGSNVFIRTPDSLKVKSIINGKNMALFKLIYEVTRSKDVHKQCTTGSYGSKKFGSCYSFYHAKDKYGITYTFMQKGKKKMISLNDAKNIF